MDRLQMSVQECQELHLLSTKLQADRVIERCLGVTTHASVTVL